MPVLCLPAGSNMHNCHPTPVAYWWYDVAVSAPPIAAMHAAYVCCRGMPICAAVPDPTFDDEVWLCSGGSANLRSASGPASVWIPCTRLVPGRLIWSSVAVNAGCRMPHAALDFPLLHGADFSTSVRAETEEALLHNARPACLPFPFPAVAETCNRAKS